MRFPILLASSPLLLPLPLVLILAPLIRAKSSGELCVGTASETDGSWYCAEVDRILYRNISQAGAYNRTKYIDVQKGVCEHEGVEYDGKGEETPLFGEVS